MKIIFYLSFILLFSVGIIQGTWVYKVREVKIAELKRELNTVLLQTKNDWLKEGIINHVVNKKYINFSYSLSKDGKVLTYIFKGKKKKIPLSSSEIFKDLVLRLMYDWIYENDLVEIAKIDSTYREALLKRGIMEIPYLEIREIKSGKILFHTLLPESFSKVIITEPVNLGYENEHQILAYFEEPSVFRILGRHLLLEAVFMIGFVICLVWQWKFVSRTWQDARVQTMGMAHLDHEMKKPLASVVSALESVMERRESFSAPDGMRLSLVHYRMVKMKEMVDTMLLALRNQKLSIERLEINVRKELESVVEMFQGLKSNVEIKLNIAEGTEKVRLDPVYFIYLVMNLVDNAIKYSVDIPVVEVGCRLKSNSFVMYVRDGGIGIPKQEQKHIFERFYRIKNEKFGKTTGFGLGLTFVQQVVEAYKGEIYVESKVGEGTKFTIIFPLT